MTAPERLATLIVNPASGSAKLLRSQLPAIVSALEGHGYHAQVKITTPAPRSAETLARQAQGASLVLACGGDGTVHEVVQGLAHSVTPLGVLPVGTANALARNLRLPLDPLAALERLLTFVPRVIPPGKVTCAAGTRLFAVMAGCGPDGALVHAMSTAHKSRFGRAAYYGRAARLFLTRRWPAFQVDVRLSGTSDWLALEATAVMVSRVPDLGGLFAGLTPAASLHQPALHLHLLAAPAHVSLPAWFAVSQPGLRHLRRHNRLLTTVDAAELRCTSAPSAEVHAQADGEPIGTLPISFSLVPDALTLLMPA